MSESYTHVAGACLRRTDWYENASVTGQYSDLQKAIVMSLRLSKETHAEDFTSHPGSCNRT
jgi:hypothetical protein